MKLYFVDPFSTKRLKHPEYLITHYLNHFNIPHTRVEEDPDWLVVHPLWGNALQSNMNLLTDLPENLKQRLFNGQAGLLFWYPYETEHYGNPSVIRQIENLIDTLGTNVPKTIYVTGNINTDAFESQHNLVRSCEKAFHKKIRKAREVYNDEDTDLAVDKATELWNREKNNPFMTWMHKHYPEWAAQVHNYSLDHVLMKNVDLPEDYSRNKLSQDLLRILLQGDGYGKIAKVPLLFFDMQLHNYLGSKGEHDQIIQSDWYNWNKSKAFMCLNGKAKDHRRYTVQKILENDLDQHGSISYVCYDGTDPKMPPILLDQNSRQLRRNDRWMNPEIYNDCWINVVTEAYAHEEIDLFITEKTFKPMLQLQPFLLVGNKGSLGYLRDMGYRTFDKLWSERYDKFETVQQRTDAVIKNLTDWCSLSQEDKQMKIKSIWDDLLHNQEMVCNTQRDVTRSAYLLEIVSAMSVGG